MPVVRISNLGQIGVINDIPRFAIPDNALSAGQNIRAFHGRLKNFGGHTFTTTAPIEPYGLFLFEAPNRQPLWLECGLAKVYVYDGVAHTDITRLTGDYTTAEYPDRWTGGIQHTMGFLCNGHADGPQMWKTIDTSTRLEDMIYDPQAGAGSRTWQDLGYTAYAMRSFKDTIVAMNLTRGPTQLPSTLQWCDFIAPGATETDWVPTASNSAGEVSLGETTGNIIDGGSLRDDFIVYKEDSAYRMTFTGSPDSPFAFQRLPDYVRVINRGCIGVASEFHVLASRDDVQFYDGNIFRSILSNRLREYYQSLMFAPRIWTTFVAPMDAQNEVWICFPTQGAGGELKHPDMAIVWNYANDTLSLTDLPQCRDMDQGLIVPAVSDTFDDNSKTFDEDFWRFDQSPYEASRQYMVGAHGTSLSIFAEEPTDNGTPRRCLAERMGLVFQDPKNGIRSSDRVHTIRSVRPYIQSTSKVQIQIGAQMTSGAVVQWEPEQDYDPAIQEELQTRATGRYFAWRVRSEADVRWELTDLEFDYTVRRKR